MTYNRDLQEDKEPRLRQRRHGQSRARRLRRDAARRSQVNAAACAAAVADPMLLATDLADYLVNRGVPFRQAHEIVGRAVALSAERGVPLPQLPLADYQAR